MKQITIEIPQGKRAIREESDGTITIKFKDIPANILDQFTSFEEAYDLSDESTKIECAIFKTDTPDVVAFKKLKLIVRLANTDPLTGEVWKPNFQDSNQRKWFPVFVLSSGFGFSDSYYYCGHAHTDVGSRLCFENQHNSDIIAKRFIDLYEVFLIG